MTFNAGLATAGAAGMATLGAIGWGKDWKGKAKVFAYTMGSVALLGLTVFTAIRTLKHQEGQDLARTLEVMKHGFKVFLFLSPLLGLDLTDEVLDYLRWRKDPICAFHAMVIAVVGGAVLCSLGVNGLEATTSLISRNFVAYGLPPLLGDALFVLTFMIYPL